ncbi:MAG: hypothetical protein UR26_C0001G0089 [candidate division TM6 bacterium GW2011_GWF2_32_72]|nr:MAG: hypothetical protein UR26_C0001G0089 [candidate division TM6 bacterium GW2011_GWF2_32_72]
MKKLIFFLTLLIPVSCFCAEQHKISDYKKQASSSLNLKVSQNQEFPDKHNNINTKEASKTIKSKTDINLNNDAEQDYTNLNQASLEDLCKPVKFTPAGIKCFLKHTYNHKEYGENFLPNNFSHFLQFLEQGNSTGQSREYSQGIIKLFNQKLKYSSYVNSAAFTEMLDQFPNLIKQHFIEKQQTSVEKITSNIKNILYNNFLSHFSFFKKSPDQFFDHISNELKSNLNPEEALEEKTSIESMRSATLRFLEHAITKLVWTPQDQAGTWENVKKIQTQLYGLVDKKIVSNVDDLDDLFQTLLHRFCYFIELTGEELDLKNFYEKVKKDMDSKSLLLLELEEKEDFIENKKQVLAKAIFKGEARAIAKQHGIIGNQIVA